MFFLSCVAFPSLLFLSFAGVVYALGVYARSPPVSGRYVYIAIAASHRIRSPFPIIIIIVIIIILSIIFIARLLMPTALSFFIATPVSIVPLP